ncbi:hypothetical protein BSL78_02680 [Apostichopus japonicus]|uniref:Phospholipase A2-like central domain-containing protein n=1 Tax=Stichopus japonicus TaxID=307972 RepID=A0A2G8LJJ3_STIJA|nr:hypothetical protein BSL78_02680 [Apostichopus japonicus]
MKLFILLPMLIACGLGSSLPETREKRNLLQFASMITCTTGRWATDYAAYGCWCGKGGHGSAVDAKMSKYILET